MMTTALIDERATALTPARYQRLSTIYDLMEGLAETRYRPWREKLWAMVKGDRILEIGVGTGKNMPFWPKGIRMTAIDLTPGMLKFARRRAKELGLTADIRLGDAQALDFPDASFATAVATFVFCSVPDPVLGLRELKRVVRPGGQVLLLEHMRSANSILGAVMDAINPLVVRMMGANINRRTVENVRVSGLSVKMVEDLGMGGIFKLIAARAGVTAQPTSTLNEDPSFGKLRINSRVVVEARPELVEGGAAHARQPHPSTARRMLRLRLAAPPLRSGCLRREQLRAG